MGIRRPHHRSFFSMAKHKLTAFVVYSAVSTMVTSEASATGDGDGAWVMHAQELNGDVHFFDDSRVERTDDVRRVWTRIRYKTSVMGASSYQSLLEIDCSGHTEKVLQRTFFTDGHWKKPAMKTDTEGKPKRRIVAGSATERLVDIVCDR